MRDVGSHRLKRTVRGALAATTVAAAVGMSAVPATADPQFPDNTSDAAKKVRELSHQAEIVTEQMKKAQDDHVAKRAELERASAEAAYSVQVANAARAEEEKFRSKGDELTNASYQGARMNKLSALLASESPNEFLNRASTLDALAKDNNDAIKRLSAAVHRAETAERTAKDAHARAARAEADTARIQGEVAAKKADMDAQVAKVKEHYSELSSAEQESLTGGSSSPVGSIGGTGAVVAAVNAALAQQGKPYAYGAKGPSSFDCSGLMQYAYEKAGIFIGGSTKTQVTEGRSVSTSELKPGDLIFYYSPVSHVSMYIGNGKAVHAPTEGDNVKVADYQSIAEVTEIRRIMA